MNLKAGDTIKFVDYARNAGIPCKILNFVCGEEERLRRIILGGLSSLDSMKDKEIQICVSKKRYSFAVEVSTKSGSDWVPFLNPDAEIIAHGISRVLRDREKGVGAGIAALEKEEGYIISKIDLNSLNFPSSCAAVLKEIL